MSKRLRTYKILKERHRSLLGRDERFRLNQRTYFLIRSYLRRSAGLTILDHGSGNGYELLNLHHSLPDNRFMGFDISPARCRVAKEALDKECPSASVVVGDGTQLPLGPDSVDLAISIQVVEHIENQIGYLREAHRVLREGGVYLLTNGNRFFPWEYHLSMPFVPWLPKKIAVFLLRLLYTDWRHNIYETIYPISTLYMKRLLRATGFTRVDYTSFTMLEEDMIATITPGFGKSSLQKASSILKCVFRLPLIGPIARKLFQVWFPYIAFTCVK